MNRKELQALAQTRLLEARALLDSGFPDGAYYLAGYAVECGLKACIAKHTRRHDFPDRKIVNASHTHNLDDLLIVADLKKAHDAQMNKDEDFRKNWRLVQDWSEHSRYQRCPADQAKQLVEATGSGKHGVMTWIKRYW